MRNPAREEQGRRRFGQVGRINVRIGKEVAGVVERHHDHNHAAKEIDRVEARRALDHGRDLEREADLPGRGAPHGGQGHRLARPDVGE